MIACQNALKATKKTVGALATAAGLDVHSDLNTGHLIQKVHGFEFRIQSLSKH